MRLALSLAVVLVLFLPHAILAQKIKPDAAVGRVVALGEIGEGEKRFILNSLQDGLGRTYKLVSEQEYARAEEQTFNELFAAQCTEDQCIRKIQEILQVDRLFVLQIIREQETTPLTLTLARSTDKLVRARRCQGCDIVRLDDLVGELVAEVQADDLGIAPVSPARAAQQEPAESAIQPVVVGYGMGVANDGFRAPQGAGTARTGEVKQLYVEYYPLERIGIGWRLLETKVIWDRKAGEAISPQFMTITNMWLTGTYVLTNPRAYLCLGATLGLGTAAYEYIATPQEGSGKDIPKEEGEGYTMLAAVYIDWGQDGFGARLGLHIISTSIASRLNDGTKIDGSGTGFAFDLRWAF